MPKYPFISCLWRRFAPLVVRVLACLVLISGATGAGLGATATGPEVEAVQATDVVQCVVTYDEAITDSYTGRVYLMLGSAEGGRGREPRFGPAWVNPAPFFARDVVDWKPGEEIVFNSTNALSFPKPLNELPERDYGAQAVMRRNLDSPNIGTGAGTAYSEVETLKIDLESPAATPLHLIINRVVEEREFQETEQVRLVQMHSKLLSDFHHRDITMNAAVILPKKYDEEPNRRFPTLYWIGGFGSTHMGANGTAQMLQMMGVGEELCVVVLDPSCYFGHHVFADSATNGPRGQALIDELIPEVEKRFRLIADPEARFLTGGSSGGWSSLWLQVTYPDSFGGTWSLVPDPVDFRDFQRINLYADDANMYFDENGNRRPLMRWTVNGQDRVQIWYEDFAKMEIVYGEGGQLRSFEAVFSPLGPDGLPMPLYDRQTGAVNPDVAEAWKKYDIRLILENNWETLGPKLEGKLHIYAGSEDNYYLEGAVRRLKKSLEDLGSDAVVRIMPGRNHGSVLDTEMMRRIEREALEHVNEHVTMTNGG